MTRILPIIVLCLAAPAAHAASPCEESTLKVPFTILGVAASSGTLQDDHGNTWTFAIPAVPPSQAVTSAMTFTPPPNWTCGTSVPPATLAAGTYTFTSNGKSIDAGCNPVGNYPTNNNVPGNQRWTWNGSTLKNGTKFLVDAGGGVAGLSATSDNWSIMQSADGAGYTLNNIRTGNYLGTNPTACYPPSYPMPMGPNKVIWTAVP